MLIVIVIVIVGCHCWLLIVIVIVGCSVCLILYYLVFLLSLLFPCLLLVVVVVVVVVVFCWLLLLLFCCLLLLVAAMSAAEEGGRTDDAQPAKRRKPICFHHGMGERVHILAFKTTAEMKDRFEYAVQQIAAEFYDLESGLTDIRVAHGQLDVTFILTFVSEGERLRFVEGQR